MSGVDLNSPIARIAAVTGEEPADIEVAFGVLVAHGWDHASMWELARETVRGSGKIVDAVNAWLARNAE